LCGVAKPIKEYKYTVGITFIFHSRSHVDVVGVALFDSADAN